VRLTYRQFVNMVAVGTDSTKQKWVSGFSPALELALDCVKSLHITDYDSTSALPALPESRYEGVETLVIRATDAWVHWPNHIFPPTLFPNANLFFQLPENGRHVESGPVARLIKYQTLPQPIKPLSSSRLIRPSHLPRALQEQPIPVQRRCRSSFSQANFRERTPTANGRSSS
jgi:hypothetical protein